MLQNPKVLLGECKVKIYCRSKNWKIPENIVGASKAEYTHNAMWDLLHLVVFFV